MSGNMGKRLTWNKSSNGAGAGAGVVTAKARSLMGAYMGGSSMKSCLDSLKVEIFYVFKATKNFAQAETCMKIDAVKIQKVEILKEHRLKPPTKSVSKMKVENKKRRREMVRTRGLKQKTTPAGSTPGISISEAHAAQRAVEEAAKKREEDTAVCIEGK
ncbi:hypothetical protein LWI29_030969 [Acer saccharum]|uniref:Uncharacterized protein n=1 Tax=Acer saccharum TaxID=4024 RepID=A0AA39V3I1_ACESA|nr:hypothetical protein LWI29_030969 [Acer saccharum]